MWLEEGNSLLWFKNGIRNTVRHSPSIFSIIQSDLTVHDQGPIIRINPTEIHVCDPDFYDVIYSHSRVRKMESIRHAFGTPGSMMNTPDQDLHHIRRAALASYFSRRQVLEFTPYIQSRIDKLCERLNNEYKSMFKVVNLKDAFTAYTSDNIIYYAFGRSYDFLGYPNFSTPFGTAVESQTEGNQIFMHFPSLLWVMQSLPKSITAAIQPSIVPLLDFRDVSVKFHMITMSRPELLYSFVTYRRSRI